MNYIAPRSKLLHHMDRITARKDGEITPPVNVEIDLSNRCSLGCQWCHFAYTHTRGPLAGSDKPDGRTPGGDLMDTALAKDITQQLADYGARGVIWTGGGEPTLHPHFDDIVKSCPIEQGMYTNGAHINLWRASLLKQRMKWVYVSLDAADKESYKNVKGVDKFYDVLTGISQLVMAKGTAVIGLGFLLNRDNWTDGERMIELGRELGVDYVQFRPAILYKQGNISRVAEYTNWVTPCAAWLESINDPFVYADWQRFEMYRDWNGRTYDTCHWTTLTTTITPNGKVWACLNKREHAEAELGDLTTESFIDIWQRSQPWTDFSRCRVMCRGHLPNLTLDKLMNEPAHMNFI